MRTACVIPAYRVTNDEIAQIVRQIREVVDDIVVVANDEWPGAARGPVADGVVKIIDVPGPVGKAEAVRLGLEWALENFDPDVVAQLDGHLKQPPRDIERLVERLALDRELDMVVANRYDDEEMRSPSHREAVTDAFSTIVRTFTGYTLVDTVAGMRAYRQALARTFADESQSFGYGLELEQIFLAHRCGVRVAEVGVNSRSQANTTAAEKLEDNLAVLIAYMGRHLVPMQRATLHRIMMGVKSRSTFEVDVTPFEGDVRYRFVFAGPAEDDEDSYRVERHRSGEVG